MLLRAAPSKQSWEQMTVQTFEIPKIKAEDNPWYLLATLYGEPSPFTRIQGVELQTRNRTVWNRLMAHTLSNERRRFLVQLGCPEIGLLPFTEGEADCAEANFIESASFEEAKFSWVAQL
jgi:hypothetical protein